MSAKTPTPASTGSLLRVTRGDYVFARLLLIAGTLALTIGTLNHHWPTGPLHFRGAVTGEGPAHTEPAMAASASARFSSELEWVLHDPSLAQRLVAAAPGALIAAGGLGIAWSLWQLLNAADRGDPFTRATVRHARCLAVLVLMLATMGPLVRIASQFYLVAQVSADPAVLITFGLTEFLPLLTGALLVVLTEVYARGLALRDETDGLV